MTQLTDAQHEMLQEYLQLLAGMREGFDYIEENLTEEAPPQVAQIFQDLIKAFEQVHKTHSQLLVIFQDEPKVIELVEECKQLVEQLSTWFEVESNEAKQQLLANKVNPSFREWQQKMEQFVQAYIAH
ncbi:hypothetical protein [Aquibacillus sediminis]|uniref:hypothetical protein n=1 Tax=Aquibacillus sediminis TaxID=2574734 RepID=UPI0011095929|nr:hypothetical protein [Aquibacillus sediminis]